MLKQYRMSVISRTRDDEKPLSEEQVNAVVSQSLPTEEYNNKEVLLIVPDATRPAPVGQLFKAIYSRSAAVFQNSM